MPRPSALPCNCILEYVDRKSDSVPFRIVMAQGLNKCPQPDVELSADEESNHNARQSYER